ncbi:hypothetical protein [Allokutzneria albata]|uniref:Uncharacterized protein n=1 Tax=Allokutzneria albata TaxID=211114 RepID=A0A1G9RS72_ALLAB|nr:hypothetical protein [Allokutzneria albata]SDM26023.1 hypothetical protein SAMN04489726_0642 [Allokutzneria albata]
MRTGGVWIGITAGVLAAGLIAGGAIWLFDEDLPLGTKEGAEATDFGPDGFGKLKIGMTKDEAIATGALGPSPVAVVTGCDDYSFLGGPLPEPARMALEAAAEKQYEAAKKENDEIRAQLDAHRGQSAQDFAARADLLARSAEALKKMSVASAESSARSSFRVRRANEHGGVSFGQGKLRLISAPPFAKTAEGIGRESSVADLQKAYEGRGMVEDRGRFEVPVSADRVLAFDAKGGKVTNFLLLSKSIRCR